MIDFLLEWLLVLKRELQTIFYIQPPLKWNHGSKGDVILIHGFNETWVFLETLGNFLNEKGYRVHTLPMLGRNFLPIEDAVTLINTYLHKQGIIKVIFLSHSKGGLIGKKLVDEDAPNRHLISIATPFHGTFWGKARVLNLETLDPLSASIQSLHISKKNETITNIYSKHDTLVFPNSSLFLKGASNYCVDIVGHTRILESEKTKKIINAVL